MRTLFGLPAKYITVLAAYTALVFVGISHHEPWFDEAQSWLMARDLGWFQLMFHQIRYEGTPGLWVSVLLIANTIHLPYAALGVIGGICAVAGMFVFLRYAPFPLPIKILFPFSFFAAYQYAVVARSYTLIPLLAFLAAHLYQTAEKDTLKFAVVLALLANVSAHGIALAVGLALAYVWQVIGAEGWSTFDAGTRRRHMWAAAIFGATLVAVVGMVLPPSDANFYAVHTKPTISSAAEVALSSIGGAFVGSAAISMAMMLALAAWCFMRGRSAVFIFPVGLVLALFICVWAQPWHHGTLLVGVVAALWIAWPTRAESGQFTGVSKVSYLAVTGLLIGMFCFQTTWTAKTFAYDWSHSFSGSRDAAQYLKAVGAEHARTCGLGFSTTAVLPYFKQNIFSNEAKLSEASFWHWEIANEASQTPESFLAEMPEFAVVGWKTDEEAAEYAQFMKDYGYSLVHESTGEMYFKDAVQQPDTYRIYRRNQAVVAGSGLKGM